MCPDRQILSVYFDHELPSPWKEQLEAHLERCPACREKLDQFGALSRHIGGNARPGEAREAELAARVETAQERVWRNISAPAIGGQIDSTVKARGGYRLWNRSITVPVPALAAAAALLVLVFSAVLVFSPRGTADGQETAEATMAAGMSPDMPAIIPVSDMSGLLQYLGEDTGDIVIIRLPESRNFMSDGKPTIIKASDYSRSGISP
ncbi:hypothetical protein FACS189483_05650 [Spirochaetia bacterium]|nr:hypothetical protein FACS189483_05650 [Spirochaetia bacterium]